MPGRTKPRVIVAITLALPLGPPAASAQWSLGLEAGPTYSTWSGSAVEASGIWGVHFDGSVERRLNARWSVVLASVWEQRGASNVRTTAGTGPLDVKSSHLSLPLTIVHTLRIGASDWSVSPSLGLALAFTVSCRVKPSAVFSFSDDCSSTPETEIPQVQLDVPVGMQLRRTYPGGSQVVVRMQYEVGMTHLLPNALLAGDQAKNRLWMLVSGFRLPLF